jgi:lipoprotein-anchoring transpeptidase ErfK/SrfK
MSLSPVDQVALLLEQAHAALRQNRLADARAFAEKAARLDPGLEEPWLILGGLSAPKDSVEYIRKALAINPNSERARKGMHWAVQRLRETERTRPVPSAPPTAQAPAAPIRAEGTQPVRVSPTRPSLEDTHPLRLKPPARASKKGSRSAWLAWGMAGGLLLVTALAILTIWLVLPGIKTALAGDPASARPIGALEKPSLTPTFTLTFTATSTATFTPTPTDTPTPTPTDTATPTATPTDTLVPTGAPPVTGEIPADIAPGEHWIDVNLSEQMVYAYEGDTVVNSFLVSTGTWQHPTVTGQYRIYVKYRYADMTGPGYYLPDVPFTMYFYEGYGLHGTYWHHNFGTPMSHGCVNLRTEDAAWLYDFADVGTLVNVHY